MNEDILDDDNSSLAPDSGSAYLAFAIKSTEVATKSATTGGSKPGTEDDYSADPIRNCALFLLNAEDKVVGFSTVDNGDKTLEKQTVTVLTKVALATKAIAIVNYNPYNSKSLLECNSLNDLKAYTENDANYRVKIGESSIDWDKVEGSASTVENVPTVSVDIVVKSRTSIIELDEFRVAYTGAGEKPVVKLTDVSLVNLKTEGGLFNEGSVINSDFEKINTNELLPGTNLYIRKNVYPNTNSNNPIQMRIKFTVGGATADAEGNPYVRTYIINRPSVEGEFVNQSGHKYVEAGYWYVLKIGVKVHTGKVECTMDYVVKDWNYKPIDLDDIYGSK